jgi:hypothetical protein
MLGIKDAVWRKLLDSPVAGISYKDVPGTVDGNPSWAVELTFSIPLAAFKSYDGWLGQMLTCKIYGEGVWNL